MRLCGINIPYEHQYAEQTAANRIHETMTTAREQGFLDADNMDIAAIIHSRAEDAQGILSAIKQRKFVDLQGSPIALDAVSEELDILSEDLAAIADHVNKTLNSAEGKKRWPELTPNVNGSSISIPDGIETLIAMSKTFKDLSTTIAQK